MAQVQLLPTSAAQARPTRGHQIDEQAGDQVEKHEAPRPEVQVDEQQALEPLFALMAHLRQHPELIQVTRDFLRELTPDE